MPLHPWEGDCYKISKTRKEHGWGRVRGDWSPGASLVGMTVVWKVVQRKVVWKPNQRMTV